MERAADSRDDVARPELTSDASDQRTSTHAPALKAVPIQPAGADRPSPAQTPPAGAAASSGEPRITVFTSTGKPLGKTFSVVAGKIKKESNVKFYAGSASTRTASTASELAALIAGLSSHQALGTGVLLEGTWARITAGANPKSGYKTRSKEHFGFPKGPGWLLWDYDTRTMPAEVAARVEALGGPKEALLSIFPEAAAGPYLLLSSSSDGVAAPGLEAERSDGLHGYFLIADVSQSKAVLETLEQRAWNAGLAWHTLNKAGQVLTRSIVDATVGSPERVVFEAAPILVAPVTRVPRRPLIKDAPEPVVVPTTTPETAARAAKREAESRRTIKPEAVRAEEAFVEEQAQTAAKRTGKPIEAARRAVRQMMSGRVLADDDLLQLGDGSRIRVGDILDNPGQWDRKSIPDPVEGVEYGRDKATIFLSPRTDRKGDKPGIVSHAHGVQTVYRFRRFMRRPSSPPPPPFHPMPEGDRAEMLDRHPGVVSGFFRWVLPHLMAMREVARGYAALGDDLGLHDRRRARMQIRRDAQRRHGLDYLPKATLPPGWEPLRVMLGGAQGVGKTRAAQGGLLEARGVVSLVLVPDHAKANELITALRSGASDHSPMVEGIKGRAAKVDKDSDETMCRVPRTARFLSQQGLSVPKTLCPICPHEKDCGYRKQEERLETLAKASEGLVVVAPREYWHLPLPGQVRPDLVVFDEAAPDLGYQSEVLSFDDLSRPLTYDGPKPRKDDGRYRSRFARDSLEANIRGEAQEKLLQLVRPILIAIRDALQDSPLTALGVLRDRGVNGARLESVLKSLSDYEDRRLGEQLSERIDEFAFGARDRQRRGLPRNPKGSFDAFLLETIEGHQGKQIRALRRLLEALRLEIDRGYEEPVAVRCSEDVGGGRRGVVVHALGQPHFGRDVPLLHLDGTGDPEIAAQLLGPMQVEWHPVERRAEVTQVVGKAFSRQSITGVDTRGEPFRAEEAAQLRDSLIAICHAQSGALVVGNKSVIRALEKAGLRNRTGHYGALRGMNTWEHIDSIIVIGREQPSPAAVEGPARALAARAGHRFTAMEPGAKYPKERRGLRMRQGAGYGVDVERHPDPWGDRVLRQIREAEVLQALDRVRPHFKPVPVRVTLLCPLALDVTVDRVERWKDAKRGKSKVDMALERRVLLLSESEAARSMSDIWPNRLAACRDEEFQRLKDIIRPELWLHPSPKGNTLLGFDTGKHPAVQVAYTRPSSGGRGGSRTTFRALVMTHPHWAQSALEKIVGPVETFQIVAMNDVVMAHLEALDARALKEERSDPAPPVHARAAWLADEYYGIDLPLAVGAAMG